MRALIVHCHPEPGSFNAALREVAVETLGRLGYAVAVSDLYAEGFDPVEGPAHYAGRGDPDRFSALGEQRHAHASGTLPRAVRREIDRLERSDLVVLQFPLWWHAPPAMLKGWFDRVFVNGGLYTSAERYDRGHFRGRRALCSVTTGAPAEALGPGARGGDLDAFLHPVHYSLHYMGFAVHPAFVAAGVQGHGYAYRDGPALRRHLDERKHAWAEHLRRHRETAPLAYPGWADWDEDGRPVGKSMPRAGLRL